MSNSFHDHPKSMTPMQPTSELGRTEFNLDTSHELVNSSSVHGSHESRVAFNGSIVSYDIIIFSRLPIPLLSLQKEE